MIGVTMKKNNIWIVNQYAMPPSKEVRVRNNKMAEHLIRNGYNVLIIGGSILHNMGDSLISDSGPNFILREYDGLKFAHIKVSDYSGNGIKRILAIIQFQLKLRKYAKRIAKESGITPDVVVTDCAPLPFYMGYRVSRLFDAIYVKEIRDLWPESLVEYGFVKEGSLFARFLYRLEKKQYEKADHIVFSMEGGADYIVDKGWDLEHGGKIDLRKVHHINNGIDLHEFDTNKSIYLEEYSQFFSDTCVNYVYVGSIGHANQLGLFLSAFDMVVREGFNMRLIIVGDGDQRKILEQKYESNPNIFFVGPVEKRCVPSILSQADVCVLCVKQTGLGKYGVSYNKLFEYLASGKPVLNLFKTNYDLLELSNAGISLDDQSCDLIRRAILFFYDMPSHERETMGARGRKIAESFDFEILTGRLISILEDFK